MVLLIPKPFTFNYKPSAPIQPATLNNCHFISANIIFIIIKSVSDIWSCFRTLTMVVNMLLYMCIGQRYIHYRFTKLHALQLDDCRHQAHLQACVRLRTDTCYGRFLCSKFVCGRVSNAASRARRSYWKTDIWTRYDPKLTSKTYHNRWNVCIIYSYE